MLAACHACSSAFHTPSGQAASFSRTSCGNPLQAQQQQPEGAVSDSFTSWRPQQEGRLADLQQKAQLDAQAAALRARMAESHLAKFRTEAKSRCGEPGLALQPLIRFAMLRLHDGRNRLLLPVTWSVAWYACPRLCCVPRHAGAAKALSLRVAEPLFFRCARPH